MERGHERGVKIHCHESLQCTMYKHFKSGSGPRIPLADSSACNKNEIDLRNWKAIRLLLPQMTFGCSAKLNLFIFRLCFFPFIHIGGCDQDWRNYTLVLRQLTNAGKKATADRSAQGPAGTGTKANMHWHWRWLRWWKWKEKQVPAPTYLSNRPAFTPFGNLSQRQMKSGTRLFSADLN